jgi:hypothetical protein
LISFRYLFHSAQQLNESTPFKSEMNRVKSWEIIADNLTNAIPREAAKWLF